MNGLRVLVMIGGLVGVLLFGLPLDAAAGQYAIILQAGTESHEGMARAVHAFLYAKELKEHGHEVVLIFDGAGTEWAEALSDPDSDSKLQPLYEELRAVAVIEVVCDYCAGAFGVKEALTERAVPMAAEYAGHPSIAKWVEQGFQLIIL